MRKADTSPARHEATCKICKHAQREEIEREFIGWTPIGRIAREFKLNRRTVYRHAHAFSLFEERDRGIRKALSRFIERCGNVRPTASAFVQAVAVFARVNANGVWINRNENTDTNELLDRMSNEELLRYAQEGVLPDWVPTTQSLIPDTLCRASRERKQ